jgi:hypothetical protein
MYYKRNKNAEQKSTTDSRWASCGKPKNEHTYEDNYDNIRTTYDN